MEGGASLLTQPHPGILHHPPLLQTIRNEQEKYWKVKKRNECVHNVHVCACDTENETERGSRKAAFRSHCSWRHCDTLSLLPLKYEETSVLSEEEMERQQKQCREIERETESEREIRNNTVSL